MALNVYVLAAIIFIIAVLIVIIIVLAIRSALKRDYIFKYLTTGKLQILRKRNAFKSHILELRKNKYPIDKSTTLPVNKAFGMFIDGDTPSPLIVTEKKTNKRWTIPLDNIIDISDRGTTILIPDKITSSLEVSTQIKALDWRFLDMAALLALINTKHVLTVANAGNSALDKLIKILVIVGCVTAFIVIIIMFKVWGIKGCIAAVVPGA